MGLEDIPGDGQRLSTVLAQGSARTAGPITAPDRSKTRSKHGLEAYRLLPGPVQLVVAPASALSDTNEPVSAPRKRRAVVLRGIREQRGSGFALSSDGVRIWWPEFTLRGDPAHHPLVLPPEGETETDMVAEFACQLR